MKVIIVGAGQVGFNTADRLSREGHDVVLIESDGSVQEMLADRVNALVLHGNGANEEVLEEAGIRDADLFIAVTDKDEVNLVACIVANEYNVHRKIARVKSGHFIEAGGRFSASKLGIDLVINPESVVADEIVNIVSHTGATDVGEFADGRVVFLGYPITAGSELADVSMRDLGALRGIYKLVVTAIARADQTLIPRGDDVIQVGDIVYFVCHKKDLPAIQYLFGFAKDEARDIFILGAGDVGTRLARRLSAGGYKVKVIDRNPKNTEALAREMDNVLVLQTDGTDVETLRNEGIEKAGAFIAVTQDDQANILCGILAKRYGAHRAIALVDHQEFVALAPNLGIDACISPRMATASAILQHVRRGDVLSMAMVEQCNAEVLEFNVSDSAPIAGKTLGALKVPVGSNIGAIVRGEQVIIPGGDDMICTDDHVIVFALPDAIAMVEDFFAAK